jgi:hypothetical protein
MKDRIPFTYLIYCKPTGQYYYGSRYGKHCHPSQLWTTYYTSSKVIKQLIRQHGEDAFDVKITRTFDCKEDARLWEYRFLCKVKASSNSKWLNQHNGDGNFLNKGGYKLSDAHRKKLSESQKGIPKPGTSISMKGNNHNKGKKFSEESKAKVSAARIGNTNRLGTTQSNETRKLISERTSAALKGIPKKTSTCPHCGKTGGSGNMLRYHFDNCKSIQ